MVGDNMQTDGMLYKKEAMLVKLKDALSTDEYRQNRWFDIIRKDLFTLIDPKSKHNQLLVRHRLKDADDLVAADQAAKYFNIRFCTNRDLQSLEQGFEIFLDYVHDYDPNSLKKWKIDQPLLDQWTETTQTFLNVILNSTSIFGIINLVYLLAGIMLIVHHQLFSFNTLSLAIVWITTIAFKFVYQKVMDRRKEKLFAKINHQKDC